MKKLPRGIVRSKIIVRLSKKNKEDSTKSIILQNLEEFFDAKYHLDHDDWDWDRFSSIGFSLGTNKNLLVGTIRTEENYPNYNFIDYDNIMSAIEFEEFQKFSREQRPDNKSFDKGLV